MYISKCTSLNTRHADILTQSHLVLAVQPDVVPLCDGLVKCESPGRACFFIHYRSLHFLPRNSSLIFFKQTNTLQFSCANATLALLLTVCCVGPGSSLNLVDLHYLKGKLRQKSKFSPVVVFGVLSRMVVVRGS